MMAKRSFGQHYLVSKEACKRIVESLDLQESDSVLEIGPGRGALTSLLLEKAGRVVAVEADRDCTAFLRAQFGNPAKLELVQMDFLKADLPSLLGGPNWKCVGNLPYNAANPILLRVLDHVSHFLRFTFMFQREVAQRIVAQSGTKTFGFLSVAVQLRAVPRILFQLSPGSFRPEPRVHSAVVVFLPKPHHPDGDNFVVHAFLEWVDILFRQRRKMLLPRLSRQMEKGRAQSAFARLQIRPDARPENLSTDQWRDLYRHLH
jgi:16S rRNA (adenine1518-N6/adenine1519-N6)-dimethyltransferase